MRRWSVASHSADSKETISSRITSFLNDGKTDFAFVRLALVSFATHVRVPDLFVESSLYARAYRGKQVYRGKVDELAGPSLPVFSANKRTSLDVCY